MSASAYVERSLRVDLRRSRVAEWRPAVFGHEESSVATGFGAFARLLVSVSGRMPADDGSRGVGRRSGSATI
jgi:hypothetical protein